MAAGANLRNANAIPKEMAAGPADDSRAAKLESELQAIGTKLDHLCGIVERLSAASRAGALASGLQEARHESRSRAALRAVRPPLPDPRLVRRIIRDRQLRARFFDAELFADPAWDMLLDLAAARAEHRRVSVTSLCIASGVPPTTALRWISIMTDAGLLDRVEDETDRRRAFISLTDGAASALANYFHELGEGGSTLV